MIKEKIYIFDTTLRDGAQTQGVDFSLNEKEKIAKSLDNLGVDYIEGGWPGANPTDTEFFNKDQNFKNANLTAFGMTKKSEHSAKNDPMLSSLINSKIVERNKARDEKNYELADKIRKDLLDKGILIEDKDGTTSWKLK